MTIAAFVIDCDGTLVATDQLWTLAEQATTERWGGTWSEALGATLTGCALLTSARLIATEVGRPLAYQSIAEHLLSAFRERLDTEPVQAKEGAPELLAALAARKIPVAVASNGRRVDVESALRGGGLLGTVAAIRCPGGSLRPKPEPDLYLAACQDLNADPARSVAIEDAQPGVLAARGAGLLTLALTTPDGPPLQADNKIGGLWPLDLDTLESMLARSTE
ncbi:MAG TPA: HAD family phosphatase [Solirubrobacteraceae bacterium]